METVRIEKKSDRRRIDKEGRRKEDSKSHEYAKHMPKQSKIKAKGFFTL